MSERLKERIIHWIDKLTDDRLDEMLEVEAGVGRFWPARRRLISGTPMV